MTSQIMFGKEEKAALFWLKRKHDEIILNKAVLKIELMTLSGDWSLIRNCFYQRGCCFYQQVDSFWYFFYYSIVDKITTPLIKIMTELNSNLSTGLLIQFFGLPCSKWSHHAFFFSQNRAALSSYTNLIRLVFPSPTYKGWI